jgi:integrase
VSPVEHRAEKIMQKQMAQASGFEAVGREWFAKFQPTWAKTHSSRIIGRLENDIFPWLGKRPIAEIKPMELLSALRRIEARGALDTAHRVKQDCGAIFRYAIATGRDERSCGRLERRAAAGQGRAFRDHH